MTLIIFLVCTVACVMVILGTVGMMFVLGNLFYAGSIALLDLIFPRLRWGFDQAGDYLVDALQISLISIPLLIIGLIVASWLIPLLPPLH